MANAKSNPVLKWAALGIVLVVAIMLFKGGDKEDIEDVNSSKDRELQKELAALNIDGDSPKETVRTLVARVKSQEEKTQQILKLNSQLVQKNNETDKQIKEELDKRTHTIKEDIKRQSNNLLSGLTGRMNELTEKMNVQMKAASQSDNSTANAFTNEGDMPVGLGFDEQLGHFDNTDAGGWILPLDLPTPDETGMITLNRRSNHHALFDDLSQPIAQSKKAVVELKKIAWYTVPENSTLMGATSMTGMIGRIPIGGTVHDPYPFKIIVSSYNLATNGHHIPGLNGMIFSGVARGDLMLSCISAKLYSVTYTFDDGTILTQREEQGADTGFQQGGGTQRRGLGWLSDEWGNPCIKGELITNAPTFLATQFALSAAEGYAKAVAENETTSTVTDSGAVIKTTTGDAKKRAGGEAVADGFSSVKEWLNARQQDSFDAIFVPSGTKVAVHIETQLEIDYDQNGRKLAYEHQNRPGYSHYLD